MTELEKINEELDKIDEIIEKKKSEYLMEWYSKPPENINFEMIEDGLDELLSKDVKISNKLNFRRKQLEEPEYSEIKIGDHMTMEEFKSHCDCGGFIDYDGYGYYATKDKMIINKVIYPSHFKKNLILEGYDYVVWFNR